MLYCLIFWKLFYRVKFVNRLRLTKDREIAEPTEMAWLAQHFTYICKLLGLKRIPKTFIICCTPDSSLDGVKKQPNGRTDIRKHSSYVIIPYAGQHTIYYLAHELFHEYLYEHESIESVEHCEMQAEAFAVAYTERTPLLNGDASSRRFLIPSKIWNKEIPAAILDDLGEDGLSMAIREQAERLAEQFFKHEAN